MFINLSNHPSTKWTDKQKEAALKYGEIRDLPFPVVSPQDREEDIQKLVQDYLKEILALSPQAVMCQGEFTFTYAMIYALKEKGIIVLASCSERRVKEMLDENGNTKKIAEFEFVQFREY